MDMYTDSCGHHEYVAVLEASRRMHSTHAQTYSMASVVDTKNWGYVDIRTEPMHTPSDDKIYFTWTL